MRIHRLLLPDGTEIASGTGEGNELRTVKVTWCVNSGTLLAPGSVCAAMLEAELFTPAGGLRLAAGDEITLFREEDSARTQLGIFRLEKPERPSANVYRITAYDRVSLLEKDVSAWLDALTEWPYALRTLAEMTCTQCGLTLAAGELPNGDYLVQKFSGSGVTARRILGWAAEAAGRFVRANAAGQLEFAWYTPREDISVAPSEGDGRLPFFGGSLTYEDYETAAIAQVRIAATGDDVGVAYPDADEGANTCAIIGNYLLTATDPETLLPVAQTLYGILKDLVYTPGKVSVPASDLRAGDIVSVTDTNGRAIRLPVMTKTESGQRDTLEATGAYRRDDAATKHTETLKALNRKTLEIRKDIEGLSVRAGNLETETAGLANQISEQTTSILQTSEEIILSALSDYETTQDAEAFRETVQAQLAVLADSITMTFSETSGQISAVSSDTDAKFTELYNYIRFSGGGITINESSGFGLELAGGRIALKYGDTVLGLWDGKDFYCGNIVVEVGERAQFGIFAFIPRSDKSLMFLKVGG